MSTLSKYLTTAQENKTYVKCFLQNGTMLEGNVAAFDEETMVLGKCLIFLDKVISITPPVEKNSK